MSKSTKKNKAPAVKSSAKKPTLAQKSKSKLYMLIAIIIAFAGAGTYMLIKPKAATLEVYRDSKIVMYACKNGTVTSPTGTVWQKVNSYAVRLTNTVDTNGFQYSNINVNLPSVTSTYNGYGVSNLTSAALGKDSYTALIYRQQGGAYIKVNGKYRNSALPTCNGYGI